MTANNTDTNVLDGNAIASMVATRQPVPASADIDDVRKGIAAVLAKGGKALSPNTKSGSKVISLLMQVDELFSIDTGLLSAWIAIRALDIKSGSQIGVSTEVFENPVIMTLLSAAGIMPTTDETAYVRAHLGEVEGRAGDTLASTARIVKISQDGSLSISNTTGQIMSVNVATDPNAALGSIDAKSSSVAQSANKIGEIAYNHVNVASLAEFTTSVYASYKVRRFEIPGATTHPTELVESSGLASVLPPAATYKPYFHSEIVKKGVLSDVQLETVIYTGEAHSKFLAAHPDDMNAAAPRQGFLVGHGTGFGKNRVVAGIFADNWAQGRRRGLWFSESAKLILDARLDWAQFGGRPEDIIDIRELSATNPILPFNGIIFSTYAALRADSAEGSRLQQLVEWFGPSEDGVIAFDEAQNLRNTRGNKENSWSTKASKQGLAAAELQDKTPNSRVVYVSATSASDIASLGFATRLGLWGRGTSFPSSESFFKAMNEGGTNALEMVARDLKAMGLYLAANLSFEGVEFEHMVQELTPDQRLTHDRLAKMWTDVGAGMKQALITTGISKIPAKAMTRSVQMGWIGYSMSRARFFQAISASLKTPMCIDAMREDLKNGHACVVQLYNTFEANADRAIQSAIDAGISMDDVEATARDILLSYLENQFPVEKWVTQGSGKSAFAVKSFDAAGNPEVCSRALALRNKFIAELDTIYIPEGPLEQILDAFGTDTVAEATGRSQRLVPTSQGGRMLEERCAKDVLKDIKAFNDDKKRILVFSQAGATGATYSAAKVFRNTRLRRHYILQAGWRADQANQGMGRTHRSNQQQPPEYILMSTDQWSDQRMISAVASGMRDLGALTRGMRQAANQGFFTSDDNLEDEFGQSAWQVFVDKLFHNQIPGLAISQFEREAGIQLVAQHELKKPLPPVKRFLNAMSAMSCDNQTLFGRYYRAELQDQKLKAIQEGVFDRGIETITPDSLIKLEDAAIYRDPRSGSETRMLKMLRVDEVEPMDYQTARFQALHMGNTRIMKSSITGRIAMLCFPRILRGAAPKGDDKVRIITPQGDRVRTRDEVMSEGWLQVDATMAEKIWNAERKERGDGQERTFWVIAGTMLPIWNKLPRSRPTVYRMETDEGEQIVGRIIEEEFVDKLLSRVDAMTGGGLSLDQVEGALKADGIVTLANGWKLSAWTSSYTGKMKVELCTTADDAVDYAIMVSEANLRAYSSHYGSEVAYFELPKAEDARTDAIIRILKEAPAASATAF